MADTQTAIVNIVAQINPLLAAATQIFGTIRSISAAARAANVTVIVDKATGTLYPSAAAAVAAGVAEENIVSELPDDAVLIANFMKEAGMLKADASAARQWLRDQMGLPAEG